MNQGNANVNRKLPGMTKPKLYFILILFFVLLGTFFFLFSFVSMLHPQEILIRFLTHSGHIYCHKCTVCQQCHR